MAIETTVIKILKTLGFDGDKKTDIVSLILTLSTLGIATWKYPDFTTKLWFLTIVLYFSLKLILELSAKILAQISVDRKTETGFINALESFSSEQNELVADLLKLDGQYLRFEISDSLFYRLQAMGKANIVEFFHSPPRNQGEKIEAAFGDRHYEIKLTKKFRDFIKKHKS